MFHDLPAKARTAKKISNRGSLNKTTCAEQATLWLGFFFWEGNSITFVRLHFRRTMYIHERPQNKNKKEEEEVTASGRTCRMAG